jgi:hypothetical protein
MGLMRIGALVQLGPIPAARFRAYPKFAWQAEQESGLRCPSWEPRLWNEQCVVAERSSSREWIWEEWT